MKQTNNAIKFLMAQYRAIFQNAYFKGLATAAVVTMSLAAGQAQAAVTLTNLATEGELQFTDTEQVAITGQDTKDWKADVKVKSVNSKGAHSIKAAAGGALTLSGSGSLTVETGAAAAAISLEAVDGKTLTVKIDNITVQSGLVDIKGAANAGTATVEANKIKVSGEQAKISLTAATQAGAATLGRTATEDKAASEITLSSGGTIAFAGTDNATDAVLKGKLAGNGGKLDFSTTKGQVEAYGTVEKLDINVDAAGEGVIKLADVDGTKDDESVLTINSGTISITGADGKLKVAGGTLDLGEGVRATAATTAGGTIDVNTGVLKLSKEQLVSFLSADGDPADVKGKLAIGANGEVFLKSSNPVNLDGFEFGDAEGKINVTAQGTISADNINIAKGLTGATDLVLKAEDTLVAGSDSFESAKGKLGATLKAKNLTLKSQESTFTLQDGVVLSSYQKTKKDDKDIRSATSGVLNSNAINISGGSVEVAAGNYEFGENVTISSGQLKVTSAVDNLNSGKVASSLKLANACRQTKNRFHSTYR